MATLVPIALFVYKRPAHARAVLESLAANPEARASHLTIFCDGPKTDDEQPLVAEVRRRARTFTGCGQVELIERPTNLGLAQSISGGVTELLRRHDRLIVLEDDLVLAAGFLRFMNDALDRYRSETKVMQVSGYMFPLSLPAAMEACFLPMVSSWGWGTWARAWKHYDPSMAGFASLARDPGARRRFDLEGTYPFFDLLVRQRAGLLDSWGIRWYLSVFEQGGLTLFPGQSYVRNRGWDGSGTHCGTGAYYDTPLSSRVVERYPDFPAVTEPAYRALQHYFRKRVPPPSLLRRVLSRMKGMLTTLKGG